MIIDECGEFERPSGVRVDSLGVIRKLVVEQLQGTVTLSGCGEIGDAIVEAAAWLPSIGGK